jgi:hypothetical protein
LTTNGAHHGKEHHHQSTRPAVDLRKSIGRRHVPGVSASLGGWNAKAVQIDVSGYSQQYVESPAHDPANLMLVMVTYGPGSKRPLTVSEISEAQFDRFAAIGYDPRSSDANETTAIRSALDLAEAIAPNVIRHQAEGKGKGRRLPLRVSKAPRAHSRSARAGFGVPGHVGLFTGAHHGHRHRHHHRPNLSRAP